MVADISELRYLGASSNLEKLESTEGFGWFKLQKYNYDVWFYESFLRKSTYDYPNLKHNQIVTKNDFIRYFIYTEKECVN